MNRSLFMCIISTFILFNIYSGCGKTNKPMICYLDDDYNEIVDGWDFDNFDSIQKAVDTVDTRA